MISVRTTTHNKLIALKNKTNLSLSTIIALSIPNIEKNIMHTLEQKKDGRNKYVIGKNASGNKK